MSPVLNRDSLHLAPIARSLSEGGRVRASFEFFPPKTEEMEQTLWTSIARLAPLNPTFVSVTYGAGGSTRERTHRTVKRMLDETALRPAAHLTCVDASRAEVDEVIQAYWDAGVRHIVALRGDPPTGFGDYTPRADGYQNATELTAAIKRIGDFEVSVGVYPEKHPQSASLAFDLDVLRQKVDAGATRGISQFFFEAETYLRYRDAVADAGIRIDLTPGIMPVTNFKGLRRMAAACEANIPDWLGGLFEGLDDDAETRKLLASAVAVELCLELEREGVRDFHFYTLNRADLVYAICRILGVKETAL
ncbi:MULTISPECIES: methylenetetrahydrofolate reductase [NAD(P)H] [Asticcacaulis]|uniref:methylenetetrahydrofolate reductase [NAD(P)H] n=1 Tax=Asticcacaulis TaxID=76890 RepID=UPI001AE7BD3E|nr:MULTISPECIES: methylenetetrahydrofolate reductase [NAD(P)H] [Asticcacaulis]MBP2157657.1 methylenetetrahydrofolate reductase (NADPH) [Asticcacaulis solisilvae]MDR6798702.1 methylenetetrahydrofolate reductase (NADPH) [Asticcacaulis sp. BE141]